MGKQENRAVQNLHLTLLSKSFLLGGKKKRRVYIQSWVKISLLLKTEGCTLQDREIVDLSSKSVN